MTPCVKKQVLLKAENICLAYNDKPVLRDICFNIKDIVRPGLTQGQVVSLVGRSGIGKTQLFKILSGLQQPTSGKVMINGSKEVQAGDMGVVFQNYQPDCCCYYIISFINFFPAACCSNYFNGSCIGFFICLHRV